MFERELSRRYLKLKSKIIQLLVFEDAFGLRQRVTPFSPYIGNDGAALQINTRWSYHTDSQKVAEFEGWLKTQVDSDVLPSGDAYWGKYVEEGYQKGAGRAFDDTRKPALATGAEPGAFYAGSKEEFLRASFAHPESIEKVKLLTSRVLTDLKGVNSVMATQMTRVLADGLVQGQNPRQIARTLNKTVEGIGRTRSRAIARTEIIRAHAEGQLDSFERLGVTKLGVMVEWSATGDDRMCELCSALDGVVMTLKETRGLLPRHTNCRCAYVPANVGEDQSKQKRTKAEVQGAIDDSIKAEMPKGRMVKVGKARVRRYKDSETGRFTVKTKRTLAQQKEKTSWVGADKKISKVRPKSILELKVTPKPTPKVTKIKPRKVVPKKVTPTKPMVPHNPKGKDTLEQFRRPDGSWVAARQTLHDSILSRELAKAGAVDKPVSYMMGGGPASGKSSIIRAGKVKLPKNRVTIDPDDLKKPLPEFGAMKQAGDSSAAAFVHNESSLLSKRLLDEAVGQKKHIVMDGTGDSNYDKLAAKITKMKRGGRKVIANYVTVDTEVAVARNLARAKKTGRLVPEAYVRQVHASISEVVPKAVKNGLFNEFALYDTNVAGKIRLVASAKGKKLVVHDEALWKRFLAKADEVKR